MINVPHMHGEEKSMESNIPVVGDEEPKHDVPTTANPHAEVANGKTSTALPASSHDEDSVAESKSEQGAAPDMGAENEHAPQAEAHAEAHAAATGDPASVVTAQTGEDSGDKIPVASETATQQPTD